ncbi:Flp family type IVb pilin [Polaromonas sp. SM01]|uniref:Flp family type IVb pilin n=1 Tax=Polaromonas sp. SM01 TaxID=3085630 RepID=UPI0029814C0F|nr:Flp family type IVb pilin [Polaromonas sp. SM01]MDW5441682.1 Flp family type IVb pilin [Polaromonas sp. SM01]
MKNSIIRFLKDEEGASAIEYGLIAGLIAVLILAPVGEIGTKLKTIFQTISNTLAPPPAPT